jgi:hypothetical protein
MKMKMSRHSIVPPYKNLVFVSFDEFIDYGKNYAIARGRGSSIINSMPWSFEFMGNPVTHENDECYLISTSDGVYKFTPKDVLKTYPDGTLIVLEK